MSVLLVAATAKEIAAFLDHYRKEDDQQETDILVTGIGLTAATYALVKQIGLKKPDLIIQAGIAGCFDGKITLGTVVGVGQDTIADQMVIENKQLKTMFDLGLAKPNEHPFHTGWLKNPYKDLLKKTKLKIVNGISVNNISADKKIIGLYQTKFNATVESMEGAALHYVCLMEKIPFVQIRSISNYIVERNKKKWKINEAITNLNKELVRFTTNLQP